MPCNNKLDEAIVKAVGELTRDELAFIRLISNSTIETSLEASNTPAAKPSVTRTTPLTEDVVSAFLDKLSPERRKQLLGL